MKKPSRSPDTVRKIMFDPQEQEIAGNYIPIWPQDRIAKGPDTFLDERRPTAKPTIRAKK